MRAVAYQTPQPITAETALVDVTLPDPVAGGHDLLVSVKAVSVNPVDTKVRMRGGAEDGGWKVLGFDAAGIVTAVGPQVTLFKPGDEVFYAGALNRQGTNSELHLVDERIVGPKPASLDFAAAAALPLTAITAWEMLFDRLKVQDGVPGAAPAVLIIGGAGGVGSIAIQLLRALTDLTVIATASRPERRIGPAHSAPITSSTTPGRWQRRWRPSVSARRASSSRPPRRTSTSARSSNCWRRRAVSA